MAKVRKRKLPSGLIRWQASYVDGAGNRRAKLFERKSDGEAWLIKFGPDLSQGLHTPAATSPTVAQAGQLWLKRGRDKNLEEMTLKGYEEHVLLHINRKHPVSNAETMPRENCRPRPISKVDLLWGVQ